MLRTRSCTASNFSMHVGYDQPCYASTGLALFRAQRAIGNMISQRELPFRICLTYCFRVFDEGLGNAHLPLFPSNARILQYGLTSRPRLALPDILAGIRGIWREQVEPGVD